MFSAAPFFEPGLLQGPAVNRSEAEISEAVRECVTVCAKVADVAKCLAVYASKLEADGWSDADVEAVIRSARQVLNDIGPQIQ